MPAHALPLRPKEPAKRPAGIPDELWYFPRNLADYANAKGLSPKQVAAIAGVSPPTVSRWLDYKIDSLAAVSVLAVASLEHGMDLERGTLTRPPVAIAEKRGA